MQLTNKSKNIKHLLTAATCGLLGSNAAVAEDVKPWAFDTAIMYYGETDRVTAVEGIIAGTKEFSDEHFLDLKLTFDTLTGASPNGAVPQNQVQTYTRPSGNGTYKVPAKTTPLDDTFRDTRIQLNAQWTQPLLENYLVSTGAHLSKEYDYLSLGFNSSIARDFNQRNTTLSAGFAFSQDRINPEGGIPSAFEQMLPAGEATNRLGADDSKTTFDTLLGVTQVINKRMIMQLNYSFSQVNGYLTDPFKVVSAVDDNGTSQKQLYESRPDSRTKHSIYWQSKYHFTENIVDFSYRYMWDDWQIASHTFDMKYRIPLGGQAEHYLEPHIRLYRQQAADFYTPFILDSQPLPNYMSADYRVGEMDGLTLGLKYGRKVGKDQSLSFRVELFAQTPKNPGIEAPGQLAQLDLYEGLKAIVAQVSYSF